MNSITAGPLVDALRCHKRKWNKKEEIWEGTPSKTKWRDLADVVRHACVDYENKTYLMDEKDVKRSQRVDGTQEKWIQAGHHPTDGSVCLTPEGDILPVGVPPKNEKKIYYRGRF